jgi:hypothetical protein
MELMQRKLRYDEHRSFKLYHLCYYFSDPRFRNTDVKRVIDFKNGEEYAVRHFIIRAIQQLQYLQLDQALLIIRALRSNETVADPVVSKSLDRLGDGLAVVFDCTYYPEVLSKTRPTQPVKTLTAVQRKAE